MFVLRTRLKTKAPISHHKASHSSEFFKWLTLISFIQSAYFASMFSGHWKESNEDVIRMEIMDPNINLDSLRLVLGSLYQDELTVEPAEVIPLLATATLLQLDGVFFPP